MRSGPLPRFCMLLCLPVWGLLEQAAWALCLWMLWRLIALPQRRPLQVSAGHDHRHPGCAAGQLRVRCQAIPFPGNGLEGWGQHLQGELGRSQATERPGQTPACLDSSRDWQSSRPPLPPPHCSVQDWDEGWRLSLGLAGVPAVILLLGGLLLPGGQAGSGAGHWQSAAHQQNMSGKVETMNGGLRSTLLHLLHPRRVSKLSCGAVSGKAVRTLGGGALCACSVGCLPACPACSTAAGLVCPLAPPSACLHFGAVVPRHVFCTS